MICINAKLRQANRGFDQPSIEEMDRYWDEAKQLEAQGKLAK